MFKKILDNFFIKQTISLIGIMYILLTYYTSRVTFSNQSKIDSLIKNNENFIYAFGMINY